MKKMRLRSVLCAVLVAVMFITSVPVAFADDADYIDFENKTWDELVYDFLAHYEVPEGRVTAAYYNTVTGEEHYLYGDQYMDAGSMYKVPLNMVFAERVANGELDPKGEVGGVSYQYLLEETIVHSSNDMARFLWTQLGGYQPFRRKIAPYMGEDPDTVDWKYYENNFFTARQVTNCLRLLYDENERFPQVIETMLKAEQKNYFCKWEHRYPIAHKYGYDIVNDVLNMNDCGIVYTDEPIIIVICTSGIQSPYTVMGEYATLMCDYTQYHIEQKRLAEELAAQREAQAKEAAEVALSFRSISSYLPDSLQSPVRILAAGAENAGEDYLVHPTLAVIAGLILLLIILCIGFIAKRNKGEKIGTLWAVIAVLATGLAGLACVIAMIFGTIFAKTTGDPAETVKLFLSDIKDGRYEQACEYLSNYTDLGLDGSAEDENGALIVDALKKSYEFTVSPAETDRSKATVTVKARYLSLPNLDAAVQDRIPDTLRVITNEHSGEDIYAEGGNYTQTILDETYTRALKTVLENASKYCTVYDVKIELEYEEGNWYILAAPDLMYVLTGGIAD